MTTPPPFQPRGVIPACLLPFDRDLTIDEPAFRAHLNDVAAVEGITALTINTHATEVATCSIEEQERVMAITMDEVGGRVPVACLWRRAARARRPRRQGSASDRSGSRHGSSCHRMPERGGRRRRAGRQRSRR